MAVNGIEAYPGEVEVSAGCGDTVIVIVGLPDDAVKESCDREHFVTSTLRWPVFQIAIPYRFARSDKRGY